jgi:hypothetical protein
VIKIYYKQMNMEQMKTLILDILGNEWNDVCDTYNFDEEDLDDFIQEWTNSDCQIICCEIEDELTMRNIFDIIKYIDDNYQDMCGQNFSAIDKYKTLNNFIYFVGREFREDKYETICNENEAPS